jgi:hypothetical protein
MTADAISRRTTIPLDIIEAGLRHLELPDPGSRTPDEEGRRIVRLREHTDWGWRIVNYLKYRELQREEGRTAYHRQYWHTRKGRKGVDSTNSTATQQAQPSQPMHKQRQEADAEAGSIPTSPLAPQVSGAPERTDAPRKKGTRIPEPFLLTAEMRKWAAEECPDVDLKAVTREFVDYWRAVPGQRGTKLDWPATWRNRVREKAQPARRAVRESRYDQLAREMDHGSED